MTNLFDATVLGGAHRATRDQPGIYLTRRNGGLLASAEIGEIVDACRRWTGGAAM